MVLKSAFTFLVKPGTSRKWEIECVFWNQTSKVVESISADSKSTPKHLKKHFGFIKSFSALDDETLEIENKFGSRIQLMSTKLTPLLDDQDTMMKKTLVCLKEKGAKAVASAMNEVLESFSKFSNDQVIKPPEETVVDTQQLADALANFGAGTDSINVVPAESLNETEDNDTSESSEMNNSSILFGTDYRIDDSGFEGDNFSATYSPSPVKNNERTLSVTISRKNSLYVQDGAESGLGDKEKNYTELIEETEGKDDEESVIGTEDPGDILKVIEGIIRNAHYQPINYDSIQVPKQIRIDRDLVNKLKELLQHHPDKTQCFIGVTRVVDDSGRRIGNNQVWVNAELYVAKFELEVENAPEDVSKDIFAVVHTINQVDEIKTEIIGSFLHKNSMEFSSKLHKSMMYQDLLRMSCVTVNADSSERSKSFLRSSLRSFAKGNKNANMFIALASQSTTFLNRFEQFLRLYEEGSLNGQGLSLKHLVQNKKSVTLRIEVPLTLLKLHLKVNPKLRFDLLNKLLNKAITFSTYRKELEKNSKISDVKSKVEQISGQPFATLVESNPQLLSEDALSGFTNAKATSSGSNAQYKNLVRHVNIAVKGGSPTDLNTAEAFFFVHSDKLNLVDVVKVVENKQAIVLSLCEHSEFNRTYNYAVKQEVLKSDAVAIFVCPDEAFLKSEMREKFEEETGIIVEYVFMKLEKPISSQGFVREYLPVALVGDKKIFQNKEIKTFYHSDVKNALPLLLANIMDAEAKIVYIFHHPGHAFDLDPQNSMSKRNISVTYLSQKEVLEVFAVKLKEKVLKEK